MNVFELQYLKNLIETCSYLEASANVLNMFLNPSPLFIIFLLIELSSFYSIAIYSKYIYLYRAANLCIYLHYKNLSLSKVYSSTIVYQSDFNSFSLFNLKFFLTIAKLGNYLWHRPIFTLFQSAKSLC